MKTESLSTTAPCTAVHRLRRDYLDLIKDPIPFAVAAPDPSNWFDFHFCIFGSPDTPYEGGYYHGRIVFPSEFPFKPPTFIFLTPSGRFEISKAICLSISHYEPKNTPTFGSISTTVKDKQRLAKSSVEYNLRDATFCEMFATVAEKMRRDIMGENRRSAGKIYLDTQENSDNESESDLDSVYDFLE
uniref:UBC core domain-containing protein n=1 Tax=Ditylenchus dipsaci TaxID=166011 RepID=A0A915E992_9BILA